MFTCTKVRTGMLLVAAGAGMLIAHGAMAQEQAPTKSWDGADFRRSAEPVSISMQNKTPRYSRAQAKANGGGIAGACPNPANDCCSAGVGGGCANEECCNTVCACDPFCCTNTWDAYCAGTGYVAGCGAQLLCPDCAVVGGCGKSSQDCCAAGTGPGCSDADCCNTVCACDPFCCTTVWDAYCAGTGYVPGCGALILCPACAAAGCPKGQTPPPNDACENATVGGVLNIGDSANYTGSNLCATNDCAFFPAQGEVWLQFELAVESSVTLSYCGSVNTGGGPFGNAWLNLALGCPCTGFTGAGSFEFTSCPDGNVTINWGFLAPGVYFYPVMLDPGFGAAGDYNITVTVAEGGFTACPNPKHDCVTTGGPGCSDEACCNTVCSTDAFCCNTAWDGLCVSNAIANCDFPPPVNDACADRLSISEVCLLGFSTVGATTDGPSHAACIDVAGDGSVNQDIWYNYTASCSGNATISLCGSGYDTKLAVYDGGTCDVSDANLLACNDDSATCGGNGLQSEVTIPVVAGNVYKIRIGGFGTAAGSGSLTINNDGVPCGGGSSCAGDIAGDGGSPDGVVDVDDLLTVINNWGPCK